MDELIKLKKERILVARQVELFTNKFKQNGTIWHQQLERIDARIAELEDEDFYQEE